MPLDRHPLTVNRQRAAARRSNKAEFVEVLLCTKAFPWGRGCPVDTSAEGRSADRAGRRDRWPSEARSDEGKLFYLMSTVGGIDKLRFPSSVTLTRDSFPQGKPYSDGIRPYPFNNTNYQLEMMLLS